MYITKTVEANLKMCEEQIEKYEKTIKSLPEGELHISKCGNYYTWRVHYPDGRRIYLPKSEEETAKKLAIKKLYTTRLNDLKAEAYACIRYLNFKSKNKSAVDKLFSRSGNEIRRLLGDSYKSFNDKISEWESEPYEKYDRFSENLVIDTLKPGEKVRSKNEAIVAGQLYQLGIPYKYEKVLILGNKKYAPDFTVLDIRTFKEIPLEVFGLMGDAEYKKGFVRKMNDYINNGYIPDVNMLMFFDTPGAPISEYNVNKKLENFFINYPPIIL